MKKWRLLISFSIVLVLFFSQAAYGVTAYQAWQPNPDQEDIFFTKIGELECFKIIFFDVDGEFNSSGFPENSGILFDVPNVWVTSVEVEISDSDDDSYTAEWGPESSESEVDLGDQDLFGLFFRNRSKGTFFDYNISLAGSGYNITLPGISETDFTLVVNNASPIPTPVPGAAWILGLGLLSVVGMRRKRRE